MIKRILEAIKCIFLGASCIACSVGLAWLISHFLFEKYVIIPILGISFFVASYLLGKSLVKEHPNV